MAKSFSRSPVIFHKRNNNTKADERTPVSGIWNVIAEDSTVYTKGCKLSSEAKGNIIAANSDVNILSSTLSGKNDITPVVGIQNSKIYWDNPIQNKTSYPCALTTQDSFLNFPAPVDPTSLSSLPLGLNAFTVSGDLNKIETYPRLLNNGSIFYWDNDSSNFLWPADITELICNIRSEQDIATINYYIPKNLHRRTFTIKFNGIIATAAMTLKNFYNGTIKIIFENNNNIVTLHCINIEDLIIEGNTGTIVKGLAPKNTATIHVDNARFLKISNITFSSNEIKEIKVNDDDDKKMNPCNYKYNLYEFYKKQLFKPALEIKNSNAIIQNCTFTEYYCAIIGSCNSIITGTDNTFKPTLPFKIGTAKYRPICYLATHNSCINDGTSNFDNNDKIVKISEITLNNENRDKGNSIIPGIALPGSFFNHEHKPLIATITDTTNVVNLEDYPPIGATFMSLNGQKLKYSIETYVTTPADGYYYTGFHRHGDENKVNNSIARLRKFGDFTFPNDYVKKNEAIDILANDCNKVYKNDNNKFAYEEIIPASDSLTTAGDLNNKWVNRTFENSLLFDAIRYNFDYDRLLSTTKDGDASSSNVIFKMPFAFYQSFLKSVTGSAGQAMITKDCAYNWVNKQSVYNLSMEKTDYNVITIEHVLNRGDAELRKREMKNNE